MAIPRNLAELSELFSFPSIREIILRGLFLLSAGSLSACTLVPNDTVPVISTPAPTNSKADFESITIPERGKSLVEEALFRLVSKFYGSQGKKLSDGTLDQIVKNLSNEVYVSERVTVYTMELKETVLSLALPRANDGRYTTSIELISLDFLASKSGIINGIYDDSKSQSPSKISVSELELAIADRKNVGPFIRVEFSGIIPGDPVLSIIIYPDEQLLEELLDPNLTSREIKENLLRFVQGTNPEIMTIYQVHMSN